MMDFHSLENLACPSKVSPLVTSFLYPLGNRCVLPLYFDQIQIIGEHHIPSDGPLVIAPTHRSRWDGLVIGHALGRPATGRDLHYMVSANEMEGLQGWIIRQFGGFSIDPDAPTISVLRYGVNLLLQEKALVIFGEGDIFYKRQVDYIKPGLARIALQAQKKASQCLSKPIQVLPIGLYYSDIYPQRGSSVEVRIGSPLNVADYVQLECKKAASLLTHDLKAQLNTLMAWEEDFNTSPISAQAL